MTATPPTARTAGRCPVCSHTGPRLRFEKHGVPYHDCPACGFRFSTPDGNANLDNTVEDYESAYLQYLESDPADARNFAALLRWVRRFQEPGGRILDVGCGSGKLVRHLRAAGFDAVGLEPSDALYARYLAGEPDAFVNGEIGDLAGELAGRIDLVLSMDVIEHVLDPAAFLAGIARVLVPGGTAILSTPDVGSPTARLLGRRWHHYNRYHLSFLDEPLMRRLADDNGLDLLAHSLRGRARSLGYTLRYLFEFGLSRDAPAVVRRLDRVQIPVNVFDTMYVSLRKRHSG